MKKIILLYIGLLNLSFAAAAQGDCEAKINKLRQAYRSQISNILSDKNRTEKLLEDYRSGKTKSPGVVAPTPSNPSGGTDGDYVDWRRKYNLEKAKSASERVKRKEAESSYNALVEEKGKNDLAFQKVVNDKDSQIAAFIDTITIKEKQIDKRNETIKRQRDTISSVKETIEETIGHFLPESLQIIALYDTKNEAPYPILVSNRMIWWKENKGLSKDRIKQLTIIAEALSSSKSQSIPCTITLYKKVDDKLVEINKEDHEFIRGKQLGSLTHYALLFDEEGFIWENNGKKILGGYKKRSRLKSNSQYEITIEFINDNHKKAYHSDSFFID